tara:strand:+ start:985 stop:1863 length:879 start_codon:yes stop_codon:yes gene_type:complete
MEEQEILSAINEFYIAFKINIIDQKKGNLKDSCIPSIVKIELNKLNPLLYKSAKPSYIVKKELFDYLLSKGYILESEIPEKYIISVKGIWFYENKKLGLSEEYIYDYLTEEKFKKSFSVLKGLSEKQKLILCSMFAMRCFSKECSINILQRKKQPYWDEIFLKCLDFLQSEGYTKSLKHKDIIRKESTKTNIAKLVLDTNLPKITQLLFRHSGKQGMFFLDVTDSERRINKKRLLLLFEKIFPNLSLNQKKDILKFSKNILMEYYTKIFDDVKFTYTQPEDSLLIEEIIIFE